MIFEHTANTPAEAWRYALKQFVGNGYVVGDSKRLDGVIVTEIKNPTDRVENNPLYKQMFIDEYKKSFVMANKGGFEYRYGERLASYPDGDLQPYETVNQIEYIIRELKRDKNSRRALGITWNPFFDTGKDDVPCLQIVKCVIFRGRLNMEVVFRSHDMLKGYYPNVLGLSYLMDYIVNSLGGYTKGSLRVVSLSPHVYVDDRDHFRAVTGCKL